MSKLIVIFLLGLVITTGYLWWSNSTTENPPQISEEDSSNHATNESSQANIYRNTEWGFEFKYPDGWIISENSFRAGSSLFNVVIKPPSNDHFPDPIIINIAPTNWGEKLVRDETSLKTQLKKSKIEVYFSETLEMGLPAKSYLMPVNEIFWIDIIGKTAYETELNQVLESFKFIDTE